MKDLKKLLAVILVFLVSSNINLFAQNYDEFVDAILKKDEKQVWNYIKDGANVNEKNSEGVTPLMFAAESGNLYIVNLLIKNGADVNAVPDTKTTAIFAAVKNNFPEIVETLALNGAQINITDDAGNTPLMYATAFGFPATAWTLCKFGANINLKNQGDNAFTIAAFYGDTIIMRILLDFGADINCSDNLGFTPLMIVSQKNYSEPAKFLITNGADINIKNSQNYTALDIAAYNGSNETLSLLIEKGALDSKSNVNAMNLARSNGKDETVSLLKKFSKSGVKIKIPNSHSIGIVDEFGFFDYFTGLKYTYSLNNINADISADFLIRPYRKKVTAQETENIFYQYREFKFQAGISVQKKFTLNQKGEFNKGIFIGVSENFALSTFKGLEEPSGKFIFIPEAGFYLQNSQSLLKISYKYADYGFYDNVSSRISLSFSAILNKKISFFEKDIYVF